MRCVVVCLLVGVCAASTIYVSDSTGSDTEGTGSAAQPYKTILTALNALADSGAENITLLPGKYTGPLNTGVRVAVDSNTVRIVSEKGPVETFVGSPEDYRAFQVGGPSRNGTTTVTLPYVPINGTDDASTSGVRDDSWKTRIPNLILSGITVVGGTATKGGAVYVEGGVLKMLNCRVAKAAHGAVYIKGIDSKVLISNSIFAHNGYTNDSSPQLKSGGALFLESGSLHCDNCKFANNTALEHGGAIYVLEGTLRLSNSELIQNKAIQGGGGAIFFANSTTGSYLVTTKFRNNTAIRGGAMFVGAASAPQLINCTFTWNSASHMGGAMILADQTTIGLKRASFIQNSATHAGGAIAILGSSSALVSVSFFSANQADLGGALYFGGKAIPQIQASVLTENFANNGGGVYVADGARPTFDKTEFLMNRASRGGAIYADDNSRPKLSGCRVKQNFASMDGGALFAAFDSAPDFTECHFLDNTSNLGDPFHISASAQHQIRFTMCSVFPHPKTFNEGLLEETGFPEELHVW
eukprot:c5041_g1_i1.p1 GENE.c5041_g1_i1~~c5041_g1_i1.p1  ORF type:complete len:527 (+),score=125.08 c5041_g1_i1:28-1608(+)